MSSGTARLETDLFKIIKYTINNQLKKLIKWRKEKCMTIVLCSKGYPGKYNKNEQIGNIEKIKLKIYLYFMQEQNILKIN